MKSILPILTLLCLFIMPTTANAADITEQEARAISEEAYVYLYSLVTMDVTRRQLTNIAPGKAVARGPMNTFAHVRAYPPANMREVVRPNFDTLYSSAWIDVTKEPMILSVPDTDGRYYLMPVLDMWTDVVGVPGARTSGTKAGHFAIVQQGWKGKLPKGVQKLETSTPYVWVIGRTQTNGPSDYAAVHKVQDKYALTPLSRWGKKALPLAKFKIDPSVDMKTPPMEQVNGMSGVEFFRYASNLLKVNRPHVTDWSINERMKRIGIEAGKEFELAKLSPVVRTALNEAPKAALALIKEKIPTLARVVNGWQMNTDTMGVYGNYYLKRAIVSMVGLGANQPEDAIYPLNISDANGQPLVGQNNYVLHFKKEELPPVSAFWSVTMYDEAGFQVANSINRFAIGDRDPLKYNADGSLDLYIRAESPGAQLESNWLPAPKEGKLGVTMRLYGPKQEALDGRWNPPAIRAEQTNAD